MVYLICEIRLVHLCSLLDAGLLGPEQSSFSGMTSTWIHWHLNFFVFLLMASLSKKSNIQKSFSVKYDLLLVLPTFVLAAATLTITAGVQAGPGAGGGCDSGPGSGVRHCETQTLRGHRQWLRGLCAGVRLQLTANIGKIWMCSDVSTIVFFQKVFSVRMVVFKCFHWNRSHTSISKMFDPVNNFIFMFNPENNVFKL